MPLLSTCFPMGSKWTVEASTVSHVATVLQGSVGTTWSTTSFSEPCRGPKFQQQRNHQGYYEVTTSVQTVSRLYRGSKVNVWHGMWQCLTPMCNHICQQQPRTPVTQQTKSQPSPKLKSTRPSCRSICSDRLQYKEQAYGTAKQENSWKNLGNISSLSSGK